MKYDHIIKNGTVIDFQTMKTSVRDIYIKDGKIAPPPDRKAEADFVTDAAGKYVLPGLIDEHTHLNYCNSNIGANADLLCIPMGVTTAVDAGTSGWTNFEGFYNSNIVRYVPRVLSYLHVSPYGVHSGCIHEENHDPKDFNEDEIVRKAIKYADTIVGLKIRLCTATLGAQTGIEALRRVVEIADAVERARRSKCVIDVHYDDLPGQITLEQILEMLRPGDILSHIMQTHGETVFEDSGKIHNFVLEARKRGIWMDDCHGRVHWSFENLKKAYAAGFYPDIISSDVVRISSYIRPGFSLIHAMCVNSAAGMDTKEILKAVTYTPAKALGILEQAGTLDVGKPADICVMDIQDTDRQFDDWWGGSCPGNQMFIPLMTMRDGTVAFRQIYF